jgi:hypothetical protein
MARWRQAVELAMTEEEIEILGAIARSRSELARRVKRARMPRQPGPGTVCKILGQEEAKPHKVRYFLERRDAEFEQKMPFIARSRS